MHTQRGAIEYALKGENDENDRWFYDTSGEAAV